MSGTNLGRGPRGARAARGRAIGGRSEPGVLRTGYAAMPLACDNPTD